MSTRASRLQLLVSLLVALALTACGRSDLQFASGSGGAGQGGQGQGGHGGNGGSPPTGCTTDKDCSDPTPHCRLDDGVCVECTQTSQCPNNEVCDNFKCVGFCGPGGACDNGLSCCSPLCVDETTDPANCGQCGNACGPFPHATAGCAGSQCDIDKCDPGFDNCNGVVSDGCETNTDSDPQHCGSCNKACASDQMCSGGKCVGACGAGGMCPPNQLCCNGQCEDTQDDPNHCGSCTKVCTTPPHASVTCEMSKCAIGNCATGFGDCNGVESDGCETNFSNDPKHCGSCTKACAPNETCTGGLCVGGCGMGQTCQPGFTCCDAMNCANTTNDPSNCGMCDNKCPPIAHGTPACAGSMCKIGSCDMGFADCNNDPTDGCETNTNNDPQNCGGCNHPCGANGVCMNGMCINGCNGGPPCQSMETCCSTGCTNTRNDVDNCGMCNNVCPMGDTCANSMCKQGNNCNGGPACTGGQTCCMSGCSDTSSDPANCGMCGVACGPGQVCQNSMCETPCNGGPACTGNQTCCMTGCADTTNDPNNCGMCGHACDPTQSCVNNACASNEGAFDPIVNPTFLAPGVHNYTTINVPAGVTVYVAGPGPQSGTLDIRATGAIIIDGTIDLSGGPGLEAQITSQSTQQGRAGPGGYTGEPYESAPPSAACAFIGGNSGQLGDQVQGTTGNCAVGSTTVCINMGDPMALIFASPVAQYGGGAGIFSGFRGYGAAGGGPAGGAAGQLGALFPGEQDCSGVAGADGATNGKGGFSGLYRGRSGALGQTQCMGIQSGAQQAWVGGGGGGSIGAAAAGDLAVLTTFQTGSGGGGGSADYLNRPAFGGTSGGGGGGGALKLSTPATITIHGQLLVNGGVGGDAYIGTGMTAGCDPQPGAAGGGGSGGVIYLSAPTITTGGGATISAVGGQGGAASEFATGGNGGNGGLGRIRVSATQGTCTLSGSYNPPLVSGCNVTSGAGTPGSAYVGAYPN